MTELESLLSDLAGRRPQLIDLSLGRTERALARLGNPHKQLPPLFHVAGTNGKGSTVAFLRAILEANGSKVHTFISPHLVRFNERIVLAGEEISDDRLIDILKRCDENIGAEELTYFEMITCAAFLAFAETPADYLVLEVGLGGRLDSTNVVSSPLASVVSPVAFDHQHYLGETLSEIASEKAGIFKPCAPAVIGVQTPDALAVLEAHARNVGARPFAFGAQWDVRSEQGRLIYQDDDGLSDLAAPRLLGSHQLYNAGLAVAAIKAAGLNINDDTISRGLQSAHWPARLQRLKSGPLLDRAAELLGEETEIWLDGGHNPHAAKAIVSALGELEERSPKRLILIAGMQDKKDAGGYFEAFSGAVAFVFAVSASHDGAANPEAIVNAVESAGIPAEACKSVEDALMRACDFAEGEPPRILICGSLYLAGEILKDHA